MRKVWIFKYYIYTLTAFAFALIFTACGGGSTSDEPKNATNHNQTEENNGSMNNSEVPIESSNNNNIPLTPREQIGAIGPDISEKRTGNPFVPGYTADGTVFFDSTSTSPAFYLYGTNDGNFYDNVWPPSSLDI